MRLKSVFISEYKNLKDFSLAFDENSFIDVFVGKNGSGKSNLFEALIEIFRHIYEYDKTKAGPSFNYIIIYKIGGVDTHIEWNVNKLKIDGTERKTFGVTPRPDNVLVYYSGHNTQVSSLITQYETAFSKRIKDANPTEIRRFIGIGTDYKELLLAIILLQPADNKARSYICKKLGISGIEPDITIELQRPIFTDNKLVIENFDPTTHFWGAKGITRTFLDNLLSCVKGEFSHSSVYNSNKDLYYIPIHIELFQQKFINPDSNETFRNFDNLRTLNMLKKIHLGLNMVDGSKSLLSHFSDGQFQTVYIYSLVELFKDKNCITLLDEPDSFLHPEWQYDFLRQVFEIANNTSKSNHILMSSHSAVTLIPHVNNKIKFFEIKDNVANCYDLLKTVAIKKLSSDLIKYSEQEQILSIINTIQIEKKPVLFTEGSTDPLILKEAWYKLYEVDMPFIPFYAFSCTYISQLLTDERLQKEMGGLPMFALFDFDKAFNQWNSINGLVIQKDPLLGKVKKWKSGESYAIMLPVPTHSEIQKQVIKNPVTLETFGGESCCEIEHLFYGLPSTSMYFKSEPCVGGSKIVFKSDSDKTIFAKEVVPKLDKSAFEVFRPMFEFIKTKM
jgi:energy-coupling factor transporter ATP-binding protein EcfA2